MRVLVTGHSGHVGGPVTAHLKGLGHDVVGFDRVEGDDLLDLAAVKQAAAGCAAIVHLGALAHDTAGSPEDIMSVNVQGTWHVLLAAEAAGAQRVIHFSSAQVFGTAEGESLPGYFPIDDEHPRRPTRPYGLSKLLSEDLCAGFTARTGIPTVSLRPVWVWDRSMYQRIEERWRADPRSEWVPTWDYGGFVDVRDVATAVERALTVPLTGYHGLLLCAADVAATEPSMVLAGRAAADVLVNDPARYERDPWASMIDCSAAERVLGWRPTRRWSNRGKLSTRPPRAHTAHTRHPAACRNFPGASDGPPLALWRYRWPIAGVGERGGRAGWESGVRSAGAECGRAARLVWVINPREWRIDLYRPVRERGIRRCSRTPGGSGQAAERH
ncbi:MAG: NAD(P)-dependent oxidoreductase [Streptosporangiaceae bacterium]